MFIIAVSGNGDDLALVRSPAQFVRHFASDHMPDCPTDRPSGLDRDQLPGEWPPLAGRQKRLNVE